jgi:hypothetical protein
MLIKNYTTQGSGLLGKMTPLRGGGRGRANSTVMPPNQKVNKDEEPAYLSRNSGVYHYLQANRIHDKW